MTYTTFAWLRQIVLVVALVLSGCATGSRSADNTPSDAEVATDVIPLTDSTPSASITTRQSDPAAAAAGGLPVAIAPGDRVLFLGDQMTQQRFYTRALATALMGLMPDAGLRFFNGGKDGATAGNVMPWLDDLLSISRPTVVFISLGLNDIHHPDEFDVVRERYREQLTQLVQHLRQQPNMRVVVILGLPAVTSQPPDDLMAGGDNYKVNELSKVAEQVAAETNCIFIELFEHMRLLHLEVERVGGEPMVLGNNQPAEEAQVVMTSLMLRSMGLTAQQLDRIGWSPLLPVQMRQIRAALALPLKPVTLEQAQASRTFYESMREFDELFFRAWRLAGPRRPTRDREPVLMTAEQAWSRLQDYAYATWGRDLHKR